MIIESGAIIFFGMLLLGVKLPRRVSLKLLGRPLALDLSVSVLPTSCITVRSPGSWLRPLQA